MKKILRKELLLEIIIFSLGISSIVLFWKNNALLSALLLALYLIGNRFWHKKHDYIFYLTGAIVGLIAEAIAVQFDVWTYSNPTIIGIPMWLPLAWGLAVILLIRISETFLKIERI